jgi:RNA polymerase sigma-70 factor (ECF subfamily)
MAAGPDPDTLRMLRVKQGDVHAFEELVDRYKQPVAGLIYRMIGDLHEAQDLCQTVFLQVYKSARRYRENAKFSTWLYTIARNLCLNEIRRRSRRPTESLERVSPTTGDEVRREVQDDEGRNPVDQILELELEQKIQQTLAGLPENQRMAVLLYRQEDLSYEEISEIIGCSLSATKSLIFRARETLKQKLKPYLRTGSWPPKH